MVVFLLLIIACCLLFGSEKTKDGIATVIEAIVFVLIFGVMASCMGC